MEPEDLFAYFKAEFVRDEFIAQSAVISEYLKRNQNSVKVNDLALLNKSLAFLTENIGDLGTDTFRPINALFEAVAQGFVKEKNFDDKLNREAMVSFLDTIARIVEQTSALFERDDLEVHNERAASVLQLAFKAVSFVNDYLAGKVLFHNNPQSQQEGRKLGRVEYFTIKRSRNLRECERGISSGKLEEESAASTQESFRETDRSEGQPNPQFLIYESSALPIAFIDFLQKHSSTLTELAVLVLEVKQATSQHPSLARRLVSLGFLKDLVYIIYDNKTRFRDYFLRLAFEVMWNYVEMLEREAIASIESEDVLLIFKELFCLVLANGFKLEDKILRNELLVMINNLMESGRLAAYVHPEGSPPTIDLAKTDVTSPEFRSQSLLQILISIAVFDEMSTGQEGVNRRKKLFDLSNEDLQFKKLVVNAVHLVLRNSTDKTVLSLVERSPFVETLLAYVSPDEHPNKCVSQFSVPQIKDIQAECLLALEELATKLTSKLLKLGILGTLTRLVGRLKGDARVVSGLKILLRLLEVSHREVQQQFGENSLFDIILEHLNSGDSLQGIGDDDVLRTRTLGFMIVARGCSDHPSNQRLFAQKGGVETLQAYLRNQKVHRSEKSLLLVVSVFSCLWSCVIGNSKNEDLFLESDGFFTLMEFLESAGRVCSKLALSAVSGIMENRKSFHYFEEWISAATSRTSTQLMIALYSEEDRRFGVEYKDGVLANGSQPLNPVQKGKSEVGLRKGFSKKAFGRLAGALKSAGSDSEGQTARHVYVSVEALLVKHLKENCELIDLRRSIFAILYRIGFDRHKVSREDAQVLVVVQNYPQLRVGEIWNEIKDSFDKRRAEMTSEDYAFVERNVSDFKRLVDFCLKQQSFISREKRTQQESELTKFYDLIRHQKKYVR